ncbi:LPXTG cell wall anchor domain-containing protein [Enterococcus mundtii]|uniref:LPXTG cell wall anchor domain-containing protein n=1 Tax=Enterococcus mundtii TaxID=53346 RepID=UPI000DF8923F|nr:LPXTG cell wall anchor domain-containing protein [Enterococcus mundtii]STD25207.1 LPXTG cell wall anchor domain [Enterococcus mundtii]
MKKIIWIGLVGLLIGATTPVSAIGEGTSQVGIMFAQPEKKTIPMKIEASTVNEDQAKNVQSISRLPKTNEKNNWLMRLLGIITLIIYLSILLKRRVKHEK